MTRRELGMRTCGVVVAAFRPFRLAGQPKTLDVGLASLADGKGLNASKRTISHLSDGSRKGVRLSEAEGEGPAYLPDLQFANGTLAVDIRGKDVQGGSFVGIAFHGVDAKTYDAIYFRPFNFRTPDQARVLRAVQYIAHPAYPWERLRAEHPGQYEKPVKPVPDPNQWFRARVVVASPKVSVFVDDGAEPCLIVHQLSDRKKGLVGIWVGNTSGGDFANFTVAPA